MAEYVSKLTVVAGLVGQRVVEGGLSGLVLALDCKLPLAPGLEVVLALEGGKCLEGLGALVAYLEEGFALGEEAHLLEVESGLDLATVVLLLVVVEYLDHGQQLGQHVLAIGVVLLSDQHPLLDLQLPQPL